MNRMTMVGRVKDRGVGWLVALALVVGGRWVNPILAWSPTAALAYQKPGGQPCGGNVAGFLGITLIDCRGECTLTLDDKLKNRAWSFSVEPRITEIAPNSPAARALQAGDTIVAIDGILITTAEGGRRFANIEPGQAVTIRYRREVRVEEAGLRAETRCAPAVEGLRAIPSLSSGASASGSASEAAESSAAPRIRIQRSAAEEDRATIDGRGARAPAEKAAPESAEGSAGISWACGPCWNRQTPDGRTEWNFSAPVTVTLVWTGGPAERAGIRVGDEITAVNGNPIESKQGTEAFINLRAGQATQFTVLRDNGSKVTLTLVPAAELHLNLHLRRTTIDHPGARPPAEKAAPEIAYGSVEIGLSCMECSSTRKEDGHTEWKFSGPIKVIGMTVGGPAARAGIQLGDRITAVNGYPIESKQGAEAFSTLRAGQATQFTVLRSDGSMLTLTIVPVASDRGPRD
jgi:S1-C subfamily serine protease